MRRWVVSLRPAPGMPLQKITFDLDHFLRRLILEAMREAMAEHWLRRAREFDKVHRLPPLALFADDAEIEAAPSAMRIALACRRHAWLISTGQFEEPYDGFTEDFDNVCAEAA
jgi:hypothetical protein